MKHKNEHGVSLVELLAVLALVAMIATLILTTFFIATKYNLTETKKLKMQQEANYIITFILQKHREVEDCYSLKINDENLFFDYCDESKPDKLISNGYEYKLYHPLEPENPLVPQAERDAIEESERFYPKEDNLQMTLMLIDLSNDQLKVSIDTTFVRYKTE
ncbi:prepilin-type N-terminal cleavage/methylation domain-containing protein [Sporosarcina siberiensis]|uniref:Prepilin-type N-terminal cleavage/methylation domain-containing protein n=1 Tax=Sporosarcina siberiensis TaxID=1365606 RepID=A0ABW4SCU4_9BACL